MRLQEIKAEYAGNFSPDHPGDLFQVDRNNLRKGFCDFARFECHVRNAQNDALQPADSRKPEVHFRSGCRFGYAEPGGRHVRNNGRYGAGVYHEVSLELAVNLDWYKQEVAEVASVQLFSVSGRFFSGYFQPAFWIVHRYRSEE